MNNNSYIDKAKSTEEFTKKLCYDLGLIPKELPSWVVIDWQRTWEECLSFELYYEKKEDGLYFYVLPDKN